MELSTNPPTSGTNASKPKKGPQKKPLTTKEKIVAVKAVQEKAKAKAEAATKPKKPPKPRAFPPPDEADLLAKIKKEQAEKKKQAKGKPVTTKQKTREVRKAKKAKEAARKKNAAGSKGKDKSKGKASPSVLMTSIDGHNGSLLRYGTTTSLSTSVLVRPTERTKRIQVSIGKKPAPPYVVGPGSMANEPGHSRLSIMDLPTEIRVEIWRLVVVFPTCFVWPHTPRDKEQPDLAMTSRDIRNDVLPIFYGENVFGVDISPVRLEDSGPGAESKPSGEQLPRSLVQIRKWSQCLEKTRWFGMIRRWAFGYNPLRPLCNTSREDRDFGSFVVFLNLNEGQDHVQVHRDARCILPGADEYGKCVIEENPQWLNQAVCKVLDKHDRGRFGGSSIVELADTIRKKAANLTERRCTEVVESIESSSGIVVR